MRLRSQNLGRKIEVMTKKIENMTQNHTVVVKCVIIVIK